MLGILVASGVVATIAYAYWELRSEVRTLRRDVDRGPQVVTVQQGLTPELLSLLQQQQQQPRPGGAVANHHLGGYTHLAHQHQGYVEQQQLGEPVLLARLTGGAATAPPSSLATVQVVDMD